MRKIRAQFELSKKGQSLDRRYVIAVGDGFHSETYTLAPPDQFSDHKWDMLLGDSHLTCEWASNTEEGMYVTILRQYVNPDFDFSDPEAYRRQDWLIAEPDVSVFRLYNPFLARPFLSWGGKSRWTDDVPFSEGDSHDYTWSFSDWDSKIKETDVLYTIERLGDSDNFKEFKITLD